MLVLSAMAAVAASCAGPGVTRAPWRDTAERACLRSGAVRATPDIRQLAEVNDNGCGATRPFTVTALSRGSVGLSTAATLGCPMIPALESWLAAVVQPAAMAAFGVPVSGMTVAASYSCRPISGSPQGSMSEHAFANAFDVSAFTFADGRRVTLLGGWNGSAAERTFLRQVHSGACNHFSTVLGPEYDAAHRDHFHLDLARRNVKVCR